MRLIDADALKKDLTRFYDNEVTAKELIDEQPTVGEWVSVEDRFPEKSGRYLCRYRQNIDGKFAYCTDFGSYNFDDEGGWFVGEVTHWMPLPKPPKEESDD